MSKKTLSDTEFRSSLVVGHFGRSAELPPPGDPITVMVIRVEIDQIKPYDNNTRLVRNPKFDDIHHRIVTLGQEGELPITRRPGEAHYMIAKGGNTRLEIMRDLWKAGDARFQQVNCRFYPWTSESDVLAAHIAENEVRGDNTFIEKALALQTLRQRLEDETGETLGLREFVRRLADPVFKIGLNVSVTQMHRLRYAAQFLYPLLPEALRAGMGRAHVDSLQKIESLYRSYWQKRGPTGLAPEAQSAEFDALFGEVLSSQDSPDFVMDAVRPALEDSLSKILDRPLRSIQAEIAALSAGIELRADIPPETDDEVTPPPGQPQRPGSFSQSPVSHLSRPGTTTVPDMPGIKPRPPAAPPESGAGTGQGDYTGPTDVRSLRNRSYVLALRLAQRHGLAECVINSPRTGLGYLMDLPRDSLKTEQSRWVWWLLLSFSEQMASADRVPPENRFGTLALGNRWEEIYALVERPKWVVMPYVFLCSPHTRDADFDDVMMLMQNTRRLRGLGDDTTLWT
jgi:ParB family protein of integrating conjugative element (PFGI_1 class)